MANSTKTKQLVNKREIRAMNKPLIQILFLCTGNSCRSQIAEGFCHFLKKDLIVPYSAGIEKHGINRYAVKVMEEIGINISDQVSKTIDELPQQSFDYVITVCDHAHETCPFFPASKGVIHQGFDDPPKLAQHAKTEAEKLVYYRRVRDEIRAYIESLPNSLTI